MENAKIIGILSVLVWSGCGTPDDSKTDVCSEGTVLDGDVCRKRAPSDVPTYQTEWRGSVGAELDTEVLNVEVIFGEETLESTALFIDSETNRGISFEFTRPSAGEIEAVVTNAFCADCGVTEGMTFRGTLSDSAFTMTSDVPPFSIYAVPHDGVKPVTDPDDAFVAEVTTAVIFPETSYSRCDFVFRDRQVVDQFACGFFGDYVVDSLATLDREIEFETDLEGERFRVFGVFISQGVSIKGHVIRVSTGEVVALLGS